MRSLNARPFFTTLKFCRPQSEWLGRDTADPKLHALDVNLNESRVRPVSRGGKIGVEGVLPQPAASQITLSSVALPVRRRKRRQENRAER